MLVKRMTVALCLPLLLLPVGYSFAQSEKKAAAVKQEESAAVADESRKNKPKPGAKSPKDAPEIFKPSEEISEDLSVSFPVDI